tara:strand:- start:5591 stop:12157 length:6567 start_codon:yes stop_codon:yes gene_type:complete
MANSLDQDFDEVVVDLFEKQPEAEIKTNMIGASEKDPDKYAESFNLAEKNNLPVETVENNLDEVKKKDRQQDFNDEFDNLFDQSPESFKFLQDKDNANLASDEIGLLQSVENSFKKFGETASKGFESGVATNKLGRVAFEQNTGKIEFEPARKEIERLNEIISDDPGRDGFINGFVYPGAKILGQITDLGKGAVVAGTATASVAAIAGQLGPQVLVPEEVITVPAAFGAGAIAYMASQTYIIEAGHTYETLNQIEKEQGEKMDPLVKNGAAAFVGLANASLEMVGVKYAVAPFRDAVKKYLSNEEKDILVNKTKTAAIKKFATQYTKAVGAETATEIMQEVVNVTAEQFAGKVSFDDYKGATADETINRLLDTATEVMRGMAFLGGVGPGVGLHVDYSKARKAKKDKELMEQLGENAQNSKLLQRAPEKFRDFVSKIKGNVESVYFDVNEFETYFQSKDLDPSEVAAQLGVESVYEQSKQTGTAIEIPLENYAEKMAATEYHQDLINTMKFSPEGMNSTQAEEIINRGINDILEEESSRAQQVEAQERQDAIPSDKVFNEIKGQLRTAGRSFDVAEKEASLHKAFFKTLSNKTGVDAYSLYKGQNVSIKRELPESIRAKNITEQDLALERLRSYRGISDKKAFGDSLIESISKKGGISPNDNQAGDLRGMDLDKYHKGKGAFTKKVFQDKGQTLDDLALSLWEDGYFSELSNRPTIDDLVAKIDQELRGEPQYSDQQGDTNLQEELLNLNDFDQFLNEIGADINTMTNEEIKNLVADYEGGADLPDGTEFFQPAPKADSKEFKEWFGDSKVVDEKGEPLVVYHGSTASFDTFDKSKSKTGVEGKGQGFWFAKNIGLASAYTGIKGELKRVYLSIKQPLIRNLDEVNKDLSLEELEKYDGIINYKNGEIESYIALEPTQIKSVENKGAFNPNDANIFLQDTGDKRGSFTTGQGEKLIKLFEKADLSTFLHESGHFFLDVMGETSLQENAPQEVVEDFNNILEFLEVENIDQIKTEQHEKFARAFEAYLYEGKAPSLELASAFNRFKAWMIEVYRNIAKLNVKIDDNIRGVFDRMLATQEEIQNAQELNAYAPILTEENSGMTSEEYQSYLKSAERATEKSESELLKKTMAEIRRERLTAYKEEKIRVRDQVEEDLMQNPTNQALYYLQNGDLFKGEVSKSMKGLKLDSNKLKEVYGKEVFKFLPKAVPPIYKKEGVHPDIVADIFGFDSGDSLVKSLWNTNNLKALIEEATEAKMKERHGDILNDGSIQEEALKAIRNDDRANFLEIELQALGRKANRELPSAKQIAKKAAERFISEMKIKDLKLGKYAAAEVKAAREAQSAVAKGDFGVAVDQKRRQLFNHYIVMEGRKAETQVDKSLKYLGKFNKKEPRAKIGKAGADYLEQIDQLLENYELKRTTTLKKLKSRDSLLAFIESEKAKGNPINIAQEIVDQASVVNYKQISTEKFFGLVDSVKNIEHIARFKNKLLINEERRTIRELAQEINETTSKHKKLKKVVINPERKAERTKSFLRGLSGSVLKIQTYIEGMDGGEKLGRVHQLLKSPIDEASNNRAARMAEESDKFSAIMIKYYGKKADNALGKVKNVVSPMENLTANKKYISSIGESLTLEERLTVAFNWGNPDSREKLMAGRNWSQAQVNEILDTLEKKDWNFVQETWDYIDSFWKESSALERELSGVAADKLDIAPVSTKHGVYKGGYFPLKYSDTQIEDEKYFQEMKAGGFNSTSVSRSFQKARVSNVKRRVNLSGLSTINSHISEMVNAITMGRAVHNTNKLLKNKSIKDTIEGYLSPEAYQDFTLWLEDTASSGVSSSDALSRLMRNLRSTATIGAMGLKLSTTIIQVSGFAQSVVEVGPKNMLNGLTAMFAGGKPWEVMAQVQEKSIFMRDRSKTFNRDINDTVKAFKGEKLSSDLIKVYFYPIAKMQQFVDIPTWLAGYKAALKDGKEEKFAIQAGDLAVENSQGTGLIKGLSPIERGSLSNKSRFNEFVKLFTTFYSYFNTKLNLAVRETQKTDFKSPKDVLRLSSNYLALFWLEAVIGDFILGRLPDFDDDEPEQQFANYSMKLVLGQIAGTLPLAREVASGMQGFDAAPGGIRGLTDVARGLKTVSTLTADIWTDEEIDGYKTAMSLLSLGNVASPVKLPTGQINTVLDAIRREEQGEDVEFIEFFLKSYKK